MHLEMCIVFVNQQNICERSKNIVNDGVVQKKNERLGLSRKMIKHRFLKRTKKNIIKRFKIALTLILIVHEQFPKIIFLLNKEFVWTNFWENDYVFFTERTILLNELIIFFWKIKKRTKFVVYKRWTNKIKIKTHPSLCTVLYGFRRLYFQLEK